MKTLYMGGYVVNVFSLRIEKANVLVEDGMIIGVGGYSALDADEVIDVTDKYICPSFIDGHIHIESTMLTPYEFAKATVAHGTSIVITDPHEITNVCGEAGIEFMLQASEGLPVDVKVMLPSCIPATPFDESFKPMLAKDLLPFYQNDRVLGLAEMMNYVGVLGDDTDIQAKIGDALSMGKVVDGHAPLLTGRDLDKYVRSHITSDHECTNFDEALEKLGKGQMIMVREGTAAKNLKTLIGLFDPRYAHRCLLVADDKEPNDLINDGHIDHIIRKAVQFGADAVVAIMMASINAATYFKIKARGAIAPGYHADMLILNDVDTVDIDKVYKDGKLVAENGNPLPFEKPSIDSALVDRVLHSFNVAPLSDSAFYIEPFEERARVIEVIKGELLTGEMLTKLDFGTNNGISVERDILKVAVIERHNNTGNIGVGYINGLGLKKGAIASSVSHDSHNLIVVGTNDADMVKVANEVINMGGGNAICVDGMITDTLKLPVAGLMSELDCETLAKECERTRKAVHKLGVPEDIAPFMNMAFISLPVIPHLKITTLGLVDVDKFKIVKLSE